ncbi:MAG: hypothetical protein MNSN_08690 [Minisyncoccus archaeiphilus]|jgi:HSP20 family protein|uniref:Hsp20/alpha crystallin family protein n=1 Tax=Minisyncoccus archaeiphilus TaxID=3238481 RepID=UPI002B0DFFDE|nr:MAG: hypothetical protein MNSN_08690 [Candidatus Parcubacteria bacterium]
MFFKNKGKKQEENKHIVIEEEKQSNSWSIDEGQLVIDVYETEKELVVQSAISGIRTEDLDISLENDMLIIKGERPDPNESKSKKYFIRECYFGPFTREIILPREIDTSKIKAEIKEGILTIKMVKIERAKNKRINLDEDQYLQEEESPKKKTTRKSKPKDEDEYEEEEEEDYEEEDEEEEER